MISFMLRFRITAGELLQNKNTMQRSGLCSELKIREDRNHQPPQMGSGSRSLTALPCPA
jgi:hypothetical protein